MMRYSGYMVGAAALALVAAMPAVAQERFEPIGAATYTPRPAEEQFHTFEVPREYRNIRAVRFKIEEGSTEIRSFRVRYGEGDSERFRVGETYETGDRTEVFELDSRAPVRSIEMAYTPRGKVKISLLVDGRRAEPAPTPEPAPPPPPVAEFAELECKVVNFFADTDTYSFTPPRSVAAIRLRAEQPFDIQVHQFRVRYSNGTSERYQVNKSVPAGGRTTGIPLRNPALRVQEIVIDYASLGIGTRPARMCMDISRAVR